ncbi:MAG: ThuA domain-containing protein [Planctomycetota bacterium]|nr:ThuA domain-containing protein [Planctomycetota bacterium]
MLLTALSLYLATQSLPGEPALPRVLVYTVSAGFEHAVVKRPGPDEPSLVERALVRWGAKSQAFTAVVSRDASAFEAANLATFGAVLFYTTGELPLSDEQRASLFAFVRRGGGFVGIHSATDTFYSMPEYGEMIGAYFDGHPWHENVRVIVEDRAHAATAHFGENFEIVDEIYQFKAPFARSGCHVLLSLDATRVDAKRDGVKRSDGDFALAWTKPFGSGRVFYTALGHREEVWSDPRFEAHVVGGLRFALRTEPRVKLEAADEKRRESALEVGGDARTGHAIFSRESGPMCARCHVVNGAGASVGPDLSSVGRRLTREDIVDSILAPSASITHGFGATTLELNDGTSVFGRVVRTTPEAATLVDSAGTARVFPRNLVKSNSASSVSAMPNGLAATLTNEEFRDLVAYVCTLKTPPELTK